MANWVMHPAEAEVFDANARHLDVSIQDLMQAAGQALAAETIRIVEASEAPEHREIWVLCGSGNNGGDGFAAALSLRPKYGMGFLYCAKQLTVYSYHTKKVA